VHTNRSYTESFEEERRDRTRLTAEKTSLRPAITSSAPRHTFFVAWKEIEVIG
jgi:hypothetical protein